MDDYFLFVLKEADLASSGITITQSRSTVIDFSNEIQIDPISLLIPYPKRDNSIGRMARPFGLEVNLQAKHFQVH